MKMFRALAMVAGVLILAFALPAAADPVPNVVGMDKTKAMEVLVKARMNAMIQQQVPTDKAELKDKVMQQTPPPGVNLPPGGRVFLTVYRYQQASAPAGGQPAPGLPQLVNMNGEQAQTLLVRQGYKASTNYVQTADRARNGYVASQNPPPGARIAPGATVYLSVYRFNEPQLRMPNLVGMNDQQAIKALNNLGVEVHQLGCAYKDPSQKGRVECQDPPAGAPVTKGQKVKFGSYTYPHPSPQPCKIR
jgi:beta-lactam-binding protein with PASTA domain